MIDETDLTIDDILLAYRHGLFPMAESADSDKFYWYDPPERGQLSIPGLHIPRSLKKLVLSDSFEVKVNSDFPAVIAACAEATSERSETWINQPIQDIFNDLHKAGHAHSVECWQEGKLVGGLYGLAIGGLFAGESMFSRKPNASKVALIHLCARLWKAGFSVLDTQYINPHLEQFGVYEASRHEYLIQIQKISHQDCDFTLLNQKDISELGLVEDYLEGRDGV